VCVRPRPNVRESRSGRLRSASAASMRRTGGAAGPACANTDRPWGPCVSFGGFVVAFIAAPSRPAGVQPRTPERPCGTWHMPCCLLHPTRVQGSATRCTTYYARVTCERNSRGSPQTAQTLALGLAQHVRPLVSSRRPMSKARSCTEYSETSGKAVGAHAGRTGRAGREGTAAQKLGRRGMRNGMRHEE